MTLLLRTFLILLDLAFRITRKRRRWPYPYDKTTNKIHLPPAQVKELRRLVRDGRKVEAIKQVTQLTGAGLRISKDYSDSLAREKKRK